MTQWRKEPVYLQTSIWMANRDSPVIPLVNFYLRKTVSKIKSCELIQSIQQMWFYFLWPCCCRACDSACAKPILQSQSQNLYIYGTWNMKCCLLFYKAAAQRPAVIFNMTRSRPHLMARVYETVTKSWNRTDLWEIWVIIYKHRSYKCCHLFFSVFENVCERRVKLGLWQPAARCFMM